MTSIAGLGLGHTGGSATSGAVVAAVRVEAAGTLSDVLPSVLASLVPGVATHRYARRRLLPLPRARRAIVVLVDALGDRLVRRRIGHAPALRAALPTAYRLDSGFPSTTATSMGSFGTGLPPGAHGLVGYEVLVPEVDGILNELSWRIGDAAGPDPRRWQPEPTVFEAAEAEDVRVTRIGPGFFDGSGLTNAALRGGRFRAAADLAGRVDASLEAVQAAPQALVYLYWGDVDRIGHEHGVDSWQWTAELERVDAELGRLVASVPDDTAVYVTADHGMVDIPYADRVDLAREPTLLDGVRHVGGEPRSVQLYCRPGAVDDVVQTWRARLGDTVRIWRRDEATAAGLFGDPSLVQERSVPRIGDVVVGCLGSVAVVDSVRMRPEALALIGQHGSVTEDERAIPLFHWAARSA